MFSPACRYPGLNLLGGDLSSQKGGHGIETNSVEHCRNECKRHAECAFWTFVEKWVVNCYLKESRGPGRQMKGAVSGSLFLSCGEVVQIQSNKQAGKHESLNSDSMSRLSSQQTSLILLQRS